MSGQLYGMFGLDIKFDLDDCLRDDQILSDLGQNIMDAVKRKDWESEQDYETQFDQYIERDLKHDWKKCSHAVHKAFKTAEAFYDDFMSKDGWEDIIDTN